VRSFKVGAAQGWSLACRMSSSCGFAWSRGPRGCASATARAFLVTRLVVVVLLVLVPVSISDPAILGGDSVTRNILLL
jgi:hypothetical protein